MTDERVVHLANKTTNKQNNKQKQTKNNNGIITQASTLLISYSIVFAFCSNAQTFVILSPLSRIWSAGPGLVTSVTVQMVDQS